MTVKEKTFENNFTNSIVSPDKISYIKFKPKETL
jgi:hypothetical protein